MWATASATAAAVDLRGIGATLGTEALVWLSDIGGLSGGGSRGYAVERAYVAAGRRGEPLRKLLYALG
jgi:hypothetical protein